MRKILNIVQMHFFRCKSVWEILRFGKCIKIYVNSLFIKVIFSGILKTRLQ